MQTGRTALPILIPILLFALAGREAAAQVQIEDRQLQGQVGFTNGVLALPGLGTGSIDAQSIGLNLPFNDTGVVYGGTSLVRNQAVVVHAFTDGQYWLTTVLSLGPQQYRFGYAATSFAAPGFPNFLNGVFLPDTVAATPSSPDPITGVDLLECAAGARVHFIQSDGQGGYVSAAHAVGGSMAASPRLDPGAASPPFGFGGAQASRSFSAADPELFVRSSAQAGGPDVRYQLSVAWSFSCPEVPSQCPGAVPSRGGAAYFEGVGGVFGSFGAGGAATNPGDNAGVLFACDAEQDFFVVVPPSCDPIPPCPPPPRGTFEGCVNLIGETEQLFQSLTSVGSDSSVTNAGESPAAFSNLFDTFDPASSEGVYRFSWPANAGSVSMQSRHALDTLQGFPQVFFNSPVAAAQGPGEAETVTGADFCMVPGIYSGTVTLRDASPGGVASGATQDLDLPASYLFAFGPGGGTATRDFRGGQYNQSAGSFLIPYENIFGDPDQSAGQWSQPRMDHSFSNASTDGAFFTSGGSRIEFSQPTGAVTFTPQGFVSAAAGGTWAGALEPGTQIAPRSDRTLPVNYDLCYGKLRIQINSHNVLFFDPRISAYGGSGVDDAGTADPSDDTIYGVFPRQEWLGSPRTSDQAANVGFVNMNLPKGLYTGIGGTIKTVLGPDLTGVTQLPPINLAVDLGCGDACTAIPDAILCLSPIDRCNDPSIANTGSTTISGTLNHTRGIARGFYRIDDGAEIPIDLTAAGVTCGPAPCSDQFTVSVTGFAACRNKIEIAFVDDANNPISAFLATTLDTSSPTYRVAASIDPAQPPYVCGTPLNFSPPSNCGSVPRSIIPFPVPDDTCSSIGSPDSPLIQTSDAPDFLVPGTTIVHLGAVDACGNGAPCNVPVVIADTTAPQVNCGGGAGYTLFAGAQCDALATISAAITDNCDPPGALTVTNRIVLPGGALVDSTGGSVTYAFPEGDSAVTFTATDSHGNQNSCSIPVHVLDVAPPVLKCPFNDTIGLNSPNPELDGITLLVDYTRTTNVVHLHWIGGTPPYRIIRVPMPAHLGLDPQFAALGTVIAGLVFGNTFDDTTTLSILGTGYDYRVFSQEAGLRAFECQQPTGAVVSCVATATDNCAMASVSNTRTGSTLDASGLYPLGDTQIDFSGTDTSSNTSQCSSTVRVVDTTPPSIQCPAPLTVTTSNPAGAPQSDAAIQAWLAGVVASDLCGSTGVATDAPSAFPVTCSSASATTTVTFTATDQQGLTASCTSTLTVILDQDGDGYPCNADCNDTRADAHPGATEVCDGIDNNCDGTVDEGCGPGKVTGGGEVAIPGGVGSYGFIVQRKAAGGPVTGDLEYIDHVSGVNVHSVDFLTLNVSGTTATFSGTCTKNHTTPCTFSVYVEDNGEPGHDVDRFIITVSGEPVEGDSGPIIRGNIQIHGM